MCEACFCDTCRQLRYIEAKTHIPVVDSIADDNNHVTSYATRDLVSYLECLVIAKRFRLDLAVDVVISVVLRVRVALDIFIRGFGEHWDRQ